MRVDSSKSLLVEPYFTGVDINAEVRHVPILSAGEPVDLPGQIEIVLSETAGAVRRQRELHVSPANVHVRMVVPGLSDVGNLADELNSVGEGGAGDRSHDLCAVESPGRV